MQQILALLENHYQWIFSGIGVLIIGFFIQKSVTQKRITNIQKSGNNSLNVHGSINEQKFGDSCTSVQSSVVTIVQGLTTTEAKQIAMKVYQDNAVIYTNIANEVVTARVDDISNALIEKLAIEKNELLNSFKDPDFQYTFLEAQKGFSRRGTPELKEMLLTLLKEKAVHNTEDTKNLILNESVEKIPKLSYDQINFLTFSFLVKHSVHLSGDLREFAKYIKDILFPIFNNCKSKKLSIRHLEYHGCYSVSIGSSDFYRIFISQYSGFFSKGFLKDDFIKHIGEDQFADWMIIDCFNDQKKVQINALNENTITVTCKRNSCSNQTISTIKDFHKRSLMNKDDIKKCLEQMVPGSSTMADFWDNSLLKNCTLTTVGTAIAISYLHSIGVTGYSYDTWLSES